MWGYHRQTGSRPNQLRQSETESEAFADTAGPWSDEQAAVPVSSDDPSWGSRRAPVTIVAFSDFQCTACASGARVMRKLKDKYGPKNLRVIWKHYPLPFHQRAKPTSIAAHTVYQIAGARAFWMFHDQAFKHLRTQRDDEYPAWAASLGIDPAQFNAALAGNRGAISRKKVAQDIALGQRLGVVATPAFFINAVLIEGAQSQEQFEREVEKQLTAAKQRLAAGTAPDRLYVALTKANNPKLGAAANKAAKRAKLDTDTVWKVPVFAADPVRGNATALVTIVMFGDFQCPYCREARPTIDKLVFTYGGKLRLVWKDNPLPIHPHAEAAAQLAREALEQQGNRGFWRAYARLLENQRDLDEHRLREIADTLGLDRTKVEQALSNRSHIVAIEAGQFLADDLQATATPHFFVNGRRLKGSLSFAEFKTIIDEEIDHAQSLLARGVAAAELYDKLIEKGKTPPEPPVIDVGRPHDDAPLRGSRKAPVVIEVFADFQDPLCRKLNQILRKLRLRFGKKIALLWRHNPLPSRPAAQLAAEAAQEAYAQRGNDGFWAMHDLLYARPKPMTREALEGHAKKIGLKLKRFNRALDKGTHKPHIEFDKKAARRAGLSGTPVVLINGTLIKGPMAYITLAKLVQRALPAGKAPNADE